MNFVKMYFLLSKYYMLFSQHITILPPLHVFLELTYRCNLRCEFCQFIDILENHKPDELLKSESSTKDVKNVIDQIPRTALITLTGGEPLLRRDFFEIVEYACRRHKVHIITNGTLIHDEMAERLMALKVSNRFSSGLFWISVSIQGDESVHNSITRVHRSYVQTVTGIKTLMRYRRGKFPKINLQTVIRSENIHCLCHIIELSHQLDIGIWNLIVQNSGDHFDRGFVRSQKSRISNSAKAFNNTCTKALESAWDGLEDVIRAVDNGARESNIRLKYQMGSMQNLIDFHSGKLKTDSLFCFAPWTTLIISADGAVRSCFNTCHGNINSQSLKQMWHGDKFQKFREALKKRGIFSDCSACCMLHAKK